jgi:hypothetical protein
MTFDLFKLIKLNKNQEQEGKPVTHYPRECPECGGWIDFKNTKLGPFYVCKHCKWSCTGTEQLLK